MEHEDPHNFDPLSTFAKMTKQIYQWAIKFSRKQQTFLVYPDYQVDPGKGEGGKEAELPCEFLAILISMYLFLI